ncbi:hypothetical protein [Arsukibacterium sp.]|uniref:hypothetical protein n=1 Tax=Arsukibacterium sp. TaxID=1977258 RepID=UPI001BD371BC|nr:hypothetical protein [Arsukibacterium sp.]
MNLKVIVPLLVLVIAGCSSVPTVKLKPETFNGLKTVRLESNPDNNLMLHSVSTVDVQFVGVGFATSAGDGKGVKEFALEYMEQNNISLNELVRSQFKNKVQSDNLPIVFTQDSPNKLVLTLNVVVLGMKHGFSDEFNALFNISGQLSNGQGEVVWSYNAIPMPPAPGYSATLDEMFASPEAFIKYLSAASEPMVHKLYKHFKSGLKQV